MNDRIIGEGITFGDVLLVPARSDVVPRDVSVQTRLTARITLNLPIMSAAMDTVTESALAIALAQEGAPFIHPSVQTLLLQMIDGP